MALWITETRDGGVAMGESPNEAEAWLMIESQQRGSVTFHDGRGRAPDRWRWTVVVDDGKTHHGWADTEAEGWECVKEVVNRPHRGTGYRAPRGLYGLPPD